MLLISTNEFQANPNNYLDRVDNGQELFLESDKGQIYQIISDPHTFQDVPQEYILEPDEELEHSISFKEFKNKALTHIQKLYEK